MSIFVLLLFLANAQINADVKGNQRISNAKIEKIKNKNLKDLNIIKSELIKTGYFEDVIIDENDIIVKEKTYVTEVEFVIDGQLKDAKNFYKTVSYKDSKQLFNEYDTLINVVNIKPFLLKGVSNEEIINACTQLKMYYKIYEGLKYCDVKYKIVQNGASSKLVFYISLSQMINKTKLVLLGDFKDFNQSVLSSLVALRRKLLIFSYYEKNMMPITINQIKEYLKEKGYFNPKISYFVREMGGKSVLYLNLKKGNLCLVKKINIELEPGLETFDLKQEFLDKIVDFDKIKKFIKTIKSYYPNCDIFFDIKFNKKFSEAYLFFKIKEKNDKKYKINQININGNIITKTNVLFSHFKYFEGDMVSKEDITKMQETLREIGIFTSVELEKLEQKNDDIILNVNIQETSNVQVQAGANYSKSQGSDVDGGSIMLDYKNANFIGSAKSVGVQTSFGRNFQLLNLSLGFYRKGMHHNLNFVVGNYDYMSKKTTNEKDSELDVGHIKAFEKISFSSSKNMFEDTPLEGSISISVGLNNIRYLKYEKSLKNFYEKEFFPKRKLNFELDIQYNKYIFAPDYLIRFMPKIGITAFGSEFCNIGFEVFAKYYLISSRKLMFNFNFEISKNIPLSDKYYWNDGFKDITSLNGFEKIGPYYHKDKNALYIGGNDKVFASFELLNVIPYIEELPVHLYAGFYFGSIHNCSNNFILKNNNSSCVSSNSFFLRGSFEFGVRLIIGQMIHISLGYAIILNKTSSDAESKGVNFSVKLGL